MPKPLVCVLIFSAAAALYYPVVGHPFSNYDDADYVTANAHVRAGLHWNTATWAFSSGETGNWHPLTWISHALDTELYGLKPGGHHATNVLFHGLNAVILFLLALMGTRRFGPSLVLALLFAVHPLNVESVAWVAERKNLLSTFFFFLTLGAYGWYCRQPSAQRYAAVVILFICGLMAKPMLVTLPFVLLLLDYWPLERMKDRDSFWKLVREKIPLFVLSLASSIVTFEVQSAGNAFHPATQFSLVVRLENAIFAYGLYLWKALWPARLAVFYPHPGATIKAWQVALSCTVLAAITAITLLAGRKKYLMTGWLWFLGTMVPVIGIVQVGDQAMADRYAYIPLVGVFVMAAWAGADLLHSRKAPHILSAGVAAAVLLAYTFASVRQIGYWSSNAELWAHALAVTTNNSVAHEKLGWDLLSSNEPADALPHFQAAVQISPNDPMNHINLGTCLDANHQREEAMAEFRKAISLSSDLGQLAVAFTDLGVDLDAAGNTAGALDSYNQALELDPKMFNAYFDRGLLFEKEGRVENAVMDYRRSLELQPSVQGYLQLSHALRLLNRMPEAQLYYDKARRLASESQIAQ